MYQRAFAHVNGSLCVLAGELEMWDKAEAALEEALNASGREWVLNPADGAFYGPKIDITGTWKGSRVLPAY